MSNVRPYRVSCKFDRTPQDLSVDCRTSQIYWSAICCNGKIPVGFLVVNQFASNNWVIKTANLRQSVFVKNSHVSPHSELSCHSLTATRNHVFLYSVSYHSTMQMPPDPAAPATPPPAAPAVPPLPIVTEIVAPGVNPVMNLRQ